MISDYIRYNDIRFLDLETTTKCNLACTWCDRVRAPDHKEFPLDDIKKFFPSDFCNRLQKVRVCGNFGDPTVHGEAAEIIEWFKTNNVDNIYMDSNASTKNTTWWKDLGSLFDEENKWVNFCIDGTEKTNHIYRVNSKWYKIMENAAAFIEGGGNARWVFLVFEHNKHNIEEARTLAKKMGFKRFIVKSAIWSKPIDATHNDNIKIVPQWLTPVDTRFENIRNNKSKISCNAKKESSIFVSFEGEVFPCVIHGSARYSRNKSILKPMYENNEEGFNSLYKHTLPEIMEHPWFNHILSEKVSSPETALVPCIKRCDVNRDNKHKCFTKHEIF